MISKADAKCETCSKDGQYKEMIETMDCNRVYYFCNSNCLKDFYSPTQDNESADIVFKVQFYDGFKWHDEHHSFKTQREAEENKYYRNKLRKCFRRVIKVTTEVVN